MFNERLKNERNYIIILRSLSQKRLELLEQPTQPMNPVKDSLILEF